ncbi:hypothetical protein GCM10017779_16580 [Streptomyces capillispiralis]|uniref:VapB protein of antitoxin of type II toxin-antitoxin system n=1 Tax=Streptomyces capillispiralis TaxID=68182 RepID=A0A561TGN5_9ACTN|nr:VapB protein of antitoxin of type II toxin-antitoxin system [Streptomyces capillispiralis]GHH91201.1 hypothetical protein GCM10017779_16580 [Streptomyces capillispiralis]
MSVTQIDIDDDALGRAMALAHVRTKEEAVNLALNFYAEQQRKCFPTSIPMRRCRRTQGVGSARCNTVWPRQGSIAVLRQ